MDNEIKIQDANISSNQPESNSSNPISNPPDKQPGTPDQGVPKLDDRTRDYLEQKDREIFQARADLKAQSAELEKFKKIQDLRNKDPLAAMQEIGIDRVELANQILGGGDPVSEPNPEIKALQSQVQKLESLLETQNNKWTEQNEKSQLQMIIRSNNSLSTLNHLIKTNPTAIDGLHYEYKKKIQEQGQGIDFAKFLTDQETVLTDKIIDNLHSLTGNDTFNNKLMEKLGMSEILKKQANIPRVLSAEATGEGPRDIPRPKTPEEADRIIKEMNLKLYD